MKTIRCILVDDEPLALQRFRMLLQKSTAASDDFTVEIVGEADSGAKAVPLIYAEKPDVVFLDVQMPGLSGFDVVELLGGNRPRVVFVTAYDEFALKAFEVHALDYLTKPVRIERLEKTLLRLAAEPERPAESNALDAIGKERRAAPLTRIAVHAGEALRIVATEEIHRIEAQDKTVLVYSQNGAYHTDFTLDALELRLPTDEFIRIHRSHIVRLGAIREIIPWFSGSYCLKLHDGTQLPVARRRVADVKSLFGKG